ncbi:MAG: hypothetical protein GQ557_00220 [Mycoplasmataceae bacterium]|nr:hypothetical protein [Mycoplasmataceae bacterium]
MNNNDKLNELFDSMINKIIEESNTNNFSNQELKSFFEIFFLLIFEQTNSLKKLFLTTKKDQLIFDTNYFISTLFLIKTIFYVYEIQSGTSEDLANEILKSSSKDIKQTFNKFLGQIKIEDLRDILFSFIDEYANACLELEVNFLDASIIDIDQKTFVKTKDFLILFIAQKYLTNSFSLQSDLIPFSLPFLFFK